MKIFMVIVSSHFMKVRRKILAVVVVLFAAGLAHATQKALKVDVYLVMVNVAVTDSDGRPVTDLKAENFQLF
jgi:hypothetical protein